MAGTHDRSVQREPAVKLIDYVLKHAVGLVSVSGSNVVITHVRANPASAMGHGRSGGAARPRPLGESVHPANDQIWAQPPAVVAKRPDASVGGDQ